ncbi:MAG: hypothetical protein AMJ90_02840 [candidate division Zixibacteria bacterium SM23_73_2]|nr:MAG: hypothetical protein AMJ90_02840 [candidate division Zixibacteria bacterium SM23_73_2]
MKIDKRYLLFLIPLVLLVFWIQGCLLTGTYVIVYDIDDTIIATEKEFNSASVDLSDNDTWEDHKDDVKYVDEVGFTFKVINNSDKSATGQLYITDNDSLTTVEQVRDSATLIVEGILVGPGGTRHVTWNESMKYIKNLKVLKDQVESGEFHLYGICKEDEFKVEFRDIVAVITVTAGV